MPIDGDRAALTRGGLGFYLGLATTFVPLGMGASFASFLFLDTRDTTVTIAGALTIGIGVLELAGRSLSFIRMPSGGGEDTQGVLLRPDTWLRADGR